MTEIIDVMDLSNEIGKCIIRYAEKNELQRDYLIKSLMAAISTSLILDMQKDYKDNCLKEIDVICGILKDQISIVFDNMVDCGD